MRTLGLLSLLVIGCGTAAAAQTPAGVADLVGARGAGGENELRRRDRADPVNREPAPRIGTPSYASPDQDGRTGVAGEIGLVCFGDGQRPQAASSQEWRWNERSDRFDYSTRTELTQEHFDASLMLRLGPDGGRIRLPKKLIPPIHSRGQGDWWALDDVIVGRDRITAGYRLNGLNKPRLTVDRRSGRITVVGTGDYGFRGQCDLVNDSDGRRF